MKIAATVQEWKHTFPNNSRVILLVDDGLLNLKMLKRSVSTMLMPLVDFSQQKESVLNRIDPDKWQEVQVEVSTIQNYCFLFAANGDVALKLICQHYDDMSAVITDDQMPGEVQGVDLIERIRELETSKSRPDDPSIGSWKLRLALCTAGSSTDEQKQTYLSTLNASFILKGDKSGRLLDFLRPLASDKYQLDGRS